MLKNSGGQFMQQRNNGERTVIDIRTINEDCFVEKRKTFYEECQEFVSKKH